MRGACLLPGGAAHSVPQTVNEQMDLTGTPAGRIPPEVCNLLQGSAIRFESGHGAHALTVTQNFATARASYSLGNSPLDCARRRASTKLTPLPLDCPAEFSDLRIVDSAPMFALNSKQPRSCCTLDSAMSPLRRPVNPSFTGGRNRAAGDGRVRFGPVQRHCFEIQGALIAERVVETLLGDTHFAQQDL